MIRNIIFDWSGTLVDDLPAVWAATNQVFRRAGLDEFTLERFRAEFCLPFKLFYDRFTPGIPMPQLEEWFHGHYRDAQDGVAELPHAREFLSFCLERGIRMFVLSAVHRDHFASQAALTGFERFFERHYIEVLDKREKILQLIAEHELRAEETLLVGDMNHDIETARHGGAFSCAVLTGYAGLEQLRASEPDLIVEHLGELRQLLQRHEWDLRTAVRSSSPGATGTPVVTVGALIFNEQDEVLMIRTRKWSNLWGIPGGKIKRGEPSLDALAREIREETGLEVAGTEFVLVQDCIGSREFYRDEHFVLLNYVCRAVTGGTVTLNEEAQAFRWLGMPEALALPLNEPTRALVCEAARRGYPERFSHVP